MTAKRMLDLFVSTVGLVMLAPLFAIVAVAIKADSPGPIFYRQDRVGKGERLFRIHKFRTMSFGALSEGPLVTVAGDRRITRVGGWLRRFKIDELPQLIDVFQGTMSLVGPRPEVPRFVAYYPIEFRNEIFSIAPGITDFAAIKFRNENDLLREQPDPERYYCETILPQKLCLYLRYVRTRSLYLDLYLIVRTVAIIVWK